MGVFNPFPSLGKFPGTGLRLSRGQALPSGEKMSGGAFSKGEEPSCALQTGSVSNNPTFLSQALGLLCLGVSASGCGREKRK